MATTKSSIAGHLLRALTLRFHINKSSPLLTISVAGVANGMADKASRKNTDRAFLNSNLSFLAWFNKKFPLPKNNSWTEFHLPDAWSSKVISVLRGKPLAMASWTKMPKQGKNIGTTGANTQEHSARALSSKDAHPLPTASLSQPSLHGCGQATTAEEIGLAFKPLQTRFQQSARPSNWLDNPPLSTKHQALTSSQWHGWLRDTDEKIPQQHHK